MMLVIKAYEALVEEKGKNVIYLRLSSRCVSDLQLKDGDKMTCMVIVGTACIVCCRVYVTVQCLSVCLSHLLIMQQCVAGLLLWAQHTGDIDQLLHDWCSAGTVSSVTLSADVGS